MARAVALAPARSLEDRSVDALMHLARGTMRVLRREAFLAGLSMPQAMLLSWLAREGPRPATGWSNRVGTSPSATSELVDGLAAIHAVRRSPHPSDRRQILVEITPEGRRLFDRIRLGQREHLHRALGGLAPAELARTLRTLERLTDRLGGEDPGKNVGARSGRRRTPAAGGPHGRPRRARPVRGRHE